MVCTACSPIQSSTITRRDGTTSTIEYFNVQFTDGIDQILAETSSNATAIIKQHPLVVGAVYALRIRLNVVIYKDKEEQQRVFFKATLMDIGRKYNI